MKRKSLSLIILILTAGLVSCTKDTTVTEPEPTISTVEIVSGSLNGVSVENGVLEMAVASGGTIHGTIRIQAQNTSEPNNVAPLVIVWSWGAHETSYATIDDWIPSGASTYDVQIDLTAPDEAGYYFISFAFALELNGSQVASLTNWQVPGNPHWNDGHDIADWDSSEYNQSVSEHVVTTTYEGTGGWHDRNVPASMIKVTVNDLSTTKLLSGSINGVEVENGVLELSIDPSVETISGNLTIEATNISEPNNVAPLVMVWSWGAHETSYTTIDDWIPTGSSTYDVQIDLTAPDEAGYYFISFAFALELNGSQVASLTNWRVPGNPHWNDGHDIADWGSTEYDQSVIEHVVTTTYEGTGGWHDATLPAAMVEIVSVGTLSRVNKNGVK